MAHDVFISFSFKNQKDAEEIVNGLQSRHGISCWICTHDIRAGSSYKGAITEAIKASKVCVLIQSLDAMESEEIPKEITVALNRKKTVIPFVLDDSELNPDLEYDLARVQRIDARKPTMDERIDELAAAILKNIAIFLRDNNVKSEQADTDEARLQKTAISVNAQFIGRDKELAAVHEALTENRCVFLYGIGGIGKSEIAKQYAKMYADEYDIIVFATYSSTFREMVTNDNDIVISNFGKAAGETEDEYFKRKLDYLKKTATERTLIIVDNFDTDYDEDLEVFADGKYKILFTTRNDHSDTGYPIVPVEPIDKEAQYELFMKIYNRPLRGDDENRIRDILEYINGHTLTIELTAKMTQAKRRPSVVLDELRKSGFAAFQETVKHGFKSNTAYEYIRQLFNLSALNKEEVGIMMNMSLMPMDGVDFLDFAEWCGIEDYGVIEELIKKSWIAYDLEEDRIRLHPLISEVVEREYKPDLHNCGVLFTNLVGKVAEFRYRDMTLDEVKEYSRVLESVYLKHPEVDLQYEALYHPMAEVFNHTEKPSLSRRLAEDCLAAVVDAYGEVSRQAGTWYYRVFDILNAFFTKEDGILQTLEKAVVILGEAAPESIDNVFIKCVHLSERCDPLKEEETLKESLALLQQTKEETSRLAHNKKVLEGSIYYKMAVNYFEREMYDTALEYAEKSYKIFGSINAPYAMPWRTYPLMAFARIYSKTGNRDEAIRNGKEAIEIAREYYSEYHYQVIGRYVIFSEIYYNLGMFKEELDTLMFAREMLEQKQEQGTQKYKNVLEKIEKCRQRLD